MKLQHLTISVLATLLVCKKFTFNILLALALFVDNSGTTLTGRSDIVEPKRQDGFTFPANSSREQLCIEHDDDNSSCEGEITGTIELVMNSAIMVITPRIATVIIQDNDGKLSLFELLS